MLREANPDRALLTDLYELTMAAGFFEHSVNRRATFELFVRQLPPERSYLVAAGLDSALGYLGHLRFTDSDVEFLRDLPSFRKVSDAFFDYLRNFRFTGDVNAMPEGTLVFEGEPILQVTAPVAEAQIVETYLLSAVNYETLVASKAARVVTAAEGRPVWEFGTRRAQGPQAGVRAGRAAYVGGCAGTSNVLAGYLYGVPLAGTAAHSWTQVFPSERESFEALLETFPDTAILLIDTYETLAGAETAAAVARQTGRKIKAVRLDSGDLLVKSRQVREILDCHGLAETQIFASGDLNEYRIAELLEQGAPIDSFGVGTDLATSRDVPALAVVYKLVEIEEDGRVEYKTKFSPQKAYWPGRKQVFRFYRNASEGLPTHHGASHEFFHHDLIACAGEQYPEGVPLLEPVMLEGRRVGTRPTLDEIRARTLAGLERLPQPYRSLYGGERFPVAVSTALERLLDEVRGRYRSAASADSAVSDTGLAFLDVDTQVDFMQPTGALYVPGAETIIPNLQRLMDYACEARVPVLSSADAHPSDDPSFAQWPPHCVIGTPGQRRIAETRLTSATVIPNRRGALLPAVDGREQVEIQKTSYSVADNPNFDAVLAALGSRSFVVFGVATEYCVRESVVALRQRNVPVWLVTDAIRPMSEATGRRAIEGMVEAGVRLTTTDEVCSGALQPRVAAARM